MIGFWVAAAFLAAGAAALLLHRAAAGARLAGQSDPQIEVFRRAVLEIDDLADRDLLAPDERRQLRAEAARRLIGAADRPTAPIHASRAPVLPLLAAVVVALASLAIYAGVGSPGQPDQPFARRLADWEAHPENASPEALAATLQAIADQRPSDPTPLRKLAAVDLGLGDADGAAHALRRALTLQPGDAGLAAALGEIKVLQNGGAVTPDSQVLFQRALKLDPGQSAARYYLAKADITAGDVAGGLAQWRDLLASLPAGDARRSTLAAEISATETAGHLAEPQANPSAAPAPEMSGAIRGMVDSLAARLAARPDDPAGWVRLVRAYAVLGEVASRDKALATARTRYANRADELAALSEAARTPAMNTAAR
jgi:cytochrome c-type biogenesis protein CcmH